MLNMGNYDAPAQLRVVKIRSSDNGIASYLTPGSMHTLAASGHM